MNGIPNFFVIGTAKAGTTSLYHYLSQHPDVYLPPIKETNHFAMGDIDESRLDPVYKRDVQLDLARYIKGGMRNTVHIAHVKRRLDYEALYSGVQKEKAIGEISNSYIICPSAIPSIKSEYPEAQLLVMLRNPISRAWSHFLMNQREGKVQSNDFVTEVMQDYSASHRGWGVNHQYLELGLYAKQLKNVFKHFAPGQVKWFLFEDFVAEPDQVMRQITDHLGIDQEFHFNFSKKANQAGVPRSRMINQLLVNSGLVHSLKSLASEKQKSWVKSKLYKRGKDLNKMSSSEANFLYKFYQSDIAELSDLLSVDFASYWKIEQ